VPEMSLFKDLLEGSGLMESSRDGHPCVKQTNIKLFNAYHYTIYAPTNTSLAGFPTWEEVEAEVNPMKRAADSTKIMNMVLLHIQDGALFVGSGNQAEDGYETSLVDPATEKFVRIYAELSDNNLFVRKTQSSASIKRKVLKTAGKYNLMAREYVVNDKGSSPDEDDELYTTSTAVVHLIDGPIE
jgi:hypothetical protein